MSKKIVIGIADCPKYANYEKWMLDEAGVEVIKLTQENWRIKIADCHGVVLTGGDDIHPRFYKKEEYIARHGLKDFDELRDEFELKLLEYSQENNLPTLGICRGLQLANIYFGGTLVPDIPFFGKSDHSKREGIDGYHEVRITQGSLLNRIAGVTKGEINSAHHQSADQIGAELIVNAVSADGVVEGLERKHPEEKPFLLLVQWHPERMKDQGSSLTRNIRSAFVASARDSE